MGHPWLKRIRKVTRHLLLKSRSNGTPMAQKKKKSNGTHMAQKKKRKSSGTHMGQKVEINVGDDVQMVDVII